MTIATDMGFKIGNLYRVINDEGSSYYKVGMIVRFSRDSGSAHPQFELISGKPKITLSHRLYFIGLGDLEPAKIQDTCKASTNKPLLLLYIQQQYPNDKVLKALVESL